MRALVAAELLLLAFESASGQTGTSAMRDADGPTVYGIYFNFNSAAIKPESAPVFEEIAAALLEHPDWKLTVEGHTDSIGDEAFNHELSERRAAAVKAALVERYGVANGRLTTAGFGASRPKASNETLEGRAQNRRVDLVRLAEDASLTEDDHFVFFGVATIDEDGRICLQLRTEEPGQPVAEGYFCYDESHPDHATIRDHVGPIEVGEQKVIEPFGERR